VSGDYRRYVRTRVLAHWQTVKPAYRIVAEDGTELITSGDHRLLTERGWKYVEGTQHGARRRPHLTPGNRLLGTGAFDRTPAITPDYRDGYLTAMIRGDALLRVYRYERAGRSNGDQHQFRLALVDLEGLRRTREFLARKDVTTSDEYVFKEAVGARKRMTAI